LEERENELLDRVNDAERICNYYFYSAS